MKTQVSIFGIIAAAVLVLVVSQVVTIHKTFAQATIVSPCPLGTVPETTLTGTTVCVQPTYDGSFGNGYFGHHR